MLISTVFEESKNCDSHLATAEDVHAKATDCGASGGDPLPVIQTGFEYLSLSS
ncbi:MAG: hypothetical protein AAFN08_01935 [Cyanobacteria bacterium J06559_3]